MSQRTEGVATQARFAGLGLAAFTTFALLTAHPTAAIAAEDDGTTPVDPIDSTLVLPDEQTSEPAAEPEEAAPEADEQDATDGDGEATDPVEQQDDADAADATAGEDAVDETTDGEQADEAAPAEDAAVAAPAEAAEVADEQIEVADEQIEAAEEQIEAYTASVNRVAAAAAPEAKPSKKATPKTIKKAAPEEESEDESEEPVTYEGLQKDSTGTWRYYKKATTDDSAYAKSGCFYNEDKQKLYYINSQGVARVLKKNKKYLDTKGKKLYAADAKGKVSVVTTSHYVDDKGFLYNINADGVAKKISMKGKYLYKCSDNFIFFSLSKNSGKLATGKKGWTTSSAYGYDNKTYYFFRTSRGYIFTKYGFSKAGSYGVLANKYGYARTGNYRRGKKLYLIKANGQMLTLTDAQEKKFGYTDAGFRWATKYGDKTCPQTFNDNELYFLHKDTSSNKYLNGAYYVICGKSGLTYETDGKGLPYKNYYGNTATYKGPHVNTPYGAVLRSVYDTGHSSHGSQYTVRGDLPYIRNKQVYVTDINGSLRKQTSKDWTTQQRQAYNVVKSLGSATNYAVTVSKSTHNVYGWYRPDSSSAWIPIFQTMCSIGAPYTDDDGNWHSTLTPSVTSSTYNRYLYFSGCCYYATGFCNGFHMHSTLYNYSTGNRGDSRLGQNISHGCVRMNYNYARYIYKYLPLGSRTCVYG